MYAIPPPSVCQADSSLPPTSGATDAGSGERRGVSPAVERPTAGLTPRRSPPPSATFSPAPAPLNTFRCVLPTAEPSTTSSRRSPSTFTAAQRPRHVHAAVAVRLNGGG